MSLRLKGLLVVCTKPIDRPQEPLFGESHDSTGASAGVRPDQRCLAPYSYHRHRNLPRINRRIATVSNHTLYSRHLLVGCGRHNPLRRYAPIRHRGASMQPLVQASVFKRLPSSQASSPSMTPSPQRSGAQVLGQSVWSPSWSQYSTQSSTHPSPPAPKARAGAAIRIEIVPVITFFSPMTPSLGSVRTTPSPQRYGALVCAASALLVLPSSHDS